jgi:hypothetical protein
MTHVFQVPACGSIGPACWAGAGSMPATSNMTIHMNTRIAIFPFVLAPSSRRPLVSRDCLPEPPSVDGQQDRMQQPHWNKTKRNSVDEECDIAAQRG